MSTTGLGQSEHETAEATRRFFRWALARLGLPAPEARDAVYCLELPSEWRDEFGGADRLRFTLSTAAATDDDVQLATPRSRLARVLIERLFRSGCLAHHRPRGAPVSVHEITGPLFAAYQVDGGSVSLAGCRMEDRAILRLTLARRTIGQQPAGQSEVIYLDGEGHGVTADETAIIGLAATEATPTPPRIKPERLLRWIDLALRRAAASGGANDSSSHEARELISVDVIWCKLASGKLRLAIGDAYCEATFRDWAGKLTPPAVVCPQTGEKTFHLCATSDGRLAAAEQVETCSTSGQRMLKPELAHCAETDRWVLPEYTGTCHVTGQPVIRDQLVRCDVCRQTVRPGMLDRGSCQTCRGLKAVLVSDPRLARVLEEHPGLDRWRHWKMAEGERSYVMTASRLLIRLLIVIDKQSLEVKHLATAGRLKPAWSEVTGHRREEILS